MDDECLESDSQQEKFYSILNEAAIRQFMEAGIQRVSEVLSISEASARSLLIHFKWNEEKLLDDRFRDKENVRKEVWLLEVPNKIPDVQQDNCHACSKIDHLNTVTAAACGRYFCSACWQAHIGTQLCDDPGCLVIRCLEPSCACTVGQDIINKVAKDNDKEKYERNIIRSYIIENKMIQWCPSGCGSAVELREDNEDYNVICSCSTRFCWKCLMEPHEPVNCDTALSWILANIEESGNINGVSFDSNGPVQEALDYLHYLRHEKLDVLSEKLKEPITKLNFITEAWLQIVDCRRVLKWISVYRNCLSEHESPKSDFLQHLHDNAEFYLRRLHRLAENELQVYLIAESPVRDFNDYRAKLIHLSSFTQGYFKKLVRYIKTYFKDIVSADHRAEHGQDSRSNISVEASTEIKLATSNGQHCSLCDWTCYVCTYAGNTSSKNHCAICDHYQ